MDVKNTKEVVVAANELAITMIKLMKDGIQLTDAVELYNKIITDESFKTAMLNAYDNIKLVPEEIKELDVMEATELGIIQLSYIPKYVEALKKA